MPKINLEEYEILKRMHGGWKWIAKDKNSEIHLFECKPYKVATIWNFDDGRYDILREEKLFQFIQWEDEKPYSIAELIEEYEMAAMEEAETFSKAIGNVRSSIWKIFQDAGEAIKSVLIWMKARKQK